MSNFDSFFEFQERLKKIPRKTQTNLYFKFFFIFDLETI